MKLTSRESPKMPRHDLSIRVEIFRAGSSSKYYLFDHRNVLFFVVEWLHLTCVCSCLSQSNYRVGKVINLCSSNDNAKITGFKHRLSACNYIPLCCQNNEKEARMLTKPSSIHKTSGKSSGAEISTLRTAQTVCDETRSP